MSFNLILSGICLFSTLPALVICNGCGVGLSGYDGNFMIGNPTKPHDVPWQVAIYRQEVVGNPNSTRFICSGSILTPKIILSGAHCFYNHSTGKPASTIPYRIFVGKYAVEYFKIDDVETKEFNISRFHLPDSFHGFDSQVASDIGLIELDGTIKIGANISPLCIDTSANDTSTQRPDKGKITGWDLSVTESVDDVLRISDVYLYDNAECLPMIPIYGRGFLTTDKICAGNKPESKVGLGFGGSALVYRQNDRYYAYGIVSLNERGGTSLVLLTRIAYHMDWIQTIVQRTGQTLPH